MSILRCKSSRKRRSAEKARTCSKEESTKPSPPASKRGARTVTIPSRSSPKPLNIGERLFDSIRRRSRPVFRYPMASWRYTKPIKVAGMRNSGKKKLGGRQVKAFSSISMNNSRNGKDRGKEGGQRSVDSLHRTGE